MAESETQAELLNLKFPSSRDSIGRRIKLRSKNPRVFDRKVNAIKIKRQGPKSQK
jgi:hypothetical protein